MVPAWKLLAPARPPQEPTFEMALRRSYRLARWLVTLSPLAVLLGHGGPARAAEHAGDVALFGAYFGETLTHPGLALGLELSLASSGTRGGFRHAWVLSPELGGYHHPRNNLGLFIDVAFGWRALHRSGARVGIGVGVGYLHTLVDGRVYEVDGAVVRRVHDGGRPHVMALVPVELGWTIALPRGHAVTPFLRAIPFVRYPYNGTFLPQAAIELGVSVPLDGSPAGRDPGRGGP